MASQSAIRGKRKKWVLKLVLDFLMNDYASWNSLLELLKLERQEWGKPAASTRLIKSD